MKSVMLGAIAIVAVLFGASTVAAQGPVLVLEGGTLIDGTGRPPVTDAVVVVQGDRIRAVGGRGQVAVPPGARVIQTNGRTILPGLVDMHLHLRPWKIPLHLPYGVTTIGDIHNDTQWIIGQRALLKSGIMKGPRLFVSGARVTGPLGAQLRNAAGETVQDPSYVRDAAEARRYVRYLHALGVDYVKVDYTITDDQLAAVIDEAWKLRLPVIGHLQNIDTAMSFGMKEVEHLESVWRAQLIREGKPVPATQPIGQSGDALKAYLAYRAALDGNVDTTRLSPLIQKMVEQGVIVDVFLYLWVQPEIWNDIRPEVERLAKDPALAFVPAEEKAAWLEGPGEGRMGLMYSREGYLKVAEFMRQYAAAGGKLLISTDGVERMSIIPGLSLHHTMQGVAKMGIPTMKVIQGSTLWPAEALGIDKDYGSVEVGKVADFVIIEGDPLADIRATRNIRMVIKGGEVVDTGYDPNWVNPLPRPKTAMQP